MRKVSLLLSSAVLFGLAIVALTVSPAHAGAPHFVGTPTLSIDGDTLTVTGKEAGLGNETQILVEVSGDAQCVNRGGNEPQADNKQSFSTSGVFPVQNGKADFSLTLTADIEPDCSKSMVIRWSNVVVTDAANGLSVTLL